MTFGFRVERATSAPSNRVYDLLADVAAFREWAPLIRYSELIRQGTPDPSGAGAVRRLGVCNAASVDEKIVEARAPHYQRYIGVRGFPVSQYRGEITRQVRNYFGPLLSSSWFPARVGPFR